VDPAIVASLLQRSHGPSGPLAAVAEVLARAPMTIDQVAAACGIAVQEAAALLSELEVDGLVRVTDGGVYRLRA
jgi:predicted Rossmann fold nucleotide-binding protein DprA/Smf involved in DNA uptake